MGGKAALFYYVFMVLEKLGISVEIMDLWNFD